MHITEKQIYIPNELVVEIIRHLPFDQLIRFNQINHTSLSIIKGTVWNYHATDIRLLIKGYQFATYKICIERFSKYDWMTKSEYNKIFTNLNSRCKVTMYKIVVTESMLKSLSVVRELKLRACSLGFIEECNYKWFETIGKVSFHLCDGLQIKSLPKIRVKKFEPNVLELDDLQYMLEIDELDLRYVHFRGVVLKYFTNVSGFGFGFRDFVSYQEYIPKVKNLLLVHANITNEITPYLAHLSEIELSSCNINTTDLSWMSNAKSVELYRCTNVTDYSLRSLTNAKKVTLIDGSGILSNNGLKHLRNATNVKLHGKFNDVGLHNIRKVDTLYLSSCANFNGSGFSQLRNIRKIKLRECTGIRNSNLIHLANVEYVDLSGCRQINSDGLKHLRNVRVLKLCYCSQITNHDLKYIGHVIKLDLQGCNKITNSGLKYLNRVKILSLTGLGKINSGLKYLSSALELKLITCFQITDRELSYLSHVEILNLSSCNKITDRGLRSLTSVRRLNIEYCNLITDQGIRNLRCPVKVTTRNSNLEKAIVRYIK